MKKNYVIEVRDADGNLDRTREAELRKKHPFLFTKPAFSQEKLVYWASFGEGRNKPICALDMISFYEKIGFCLRLKTW
jgi:hypothetical protein